MKQYDSMRRFIWWK